MCIRACCRSIPLSYETNGRVRSEKNRHGILVVIVQSSYWARVSCCRFFSAVWSDQVSSILYSAWEYLLDLNTTNLFPYDGRILVDPLLWHHPCRLDRHDLLKIKYWQPTSPRTVHYVLVAFAARVSEVT